MTSYLPAANGLRPWSWQLATLPGYCQVPLWPILCWIAFEARTTRCWEQWPSGEVSVRLLRAPPALICWTQLSMVTKFCMWMSQRELRALLRDRQEKVGSASQGRTCRQRNSRGLVKLNDKAMSKEDGSLVGTETALESVSELQRCLQELERRLACAEAENQRKADELQQAVQTANGAFAEVEKGKQELQRLAVRLEHVQTQCELERHRKIEALRQEHA